MNLFNPFRVVSIGIPETQGVALECNSPLGNIQQYHALQNFSIYVL